MKNEFGCFLDSNRYAPSILQDNVGEQCFLCRREHCELVRHEVFQGSNRTKSKAYGLWITICPPCHSRIHANPASNEAKDLDQYAQKMAMAKYGWSVEDFIARIGKNYVE